MYFCFTMGVYAGIDKEYKYSLRKNPITKEELWNLDVTIAEFIYPRLKEFRNTAHGIPEEHIDDMIFAFETYVQQGYPKSINTKTREGRRIRRGMYLFYKNFPALWN
jgi:hypothetical protein